MCSPSRGKEACTLYDVAEWTGSYFFRKQEKIIYIPEWLKML